MNVFRVEKRQQFLKDSKREQIRDILSASSIIFELSFDQQWTSALLTLFSCKEDMMTFWGYFDKASKLGLGGQQMDVQSPALKEDETANNEEDINIDSSDFTNFSSLESLQIPSYFDICDNFSWRQIKQQEKPVREVSYLQWLQAIQTIITQTPYISLEGISQQLIQRYPDQKLSLQSIKSMIISMSYSKRDITKVPVERNSLENIQNRYKYCLSIYRLGKENTRMIFLDSCKLDLNLAPRQIWIKNGGPVVEKIDQNHIQIIAWITNQDKVDWRLAQRSSNLKKQQTQEIQNIIHQIASQNQEKNLAMILNSSNVPITRRIKKAAVDNKWRLFVLPPLSPQLNPVNAFFKEIKQNLKKESKISDLLELQVRLEQILLLVSNSRRFFSQNHFYLIKGLTRSFI